ncbi:hypothetical protein AZA_25334 [Nitrospirillum viridazoti Y2]|nr:hypothetical protein AZA_25334 [Nitrospirillum amazonense Y2]
MCMTHHAPPPSSTTTRADTQTLRRIEIPTFPMISGTRVYTPAVRRSCCLAYSHGWAWPVRFEKARTRLPCLVFRAFSYPENRQASAPLAPGRLGPLRRPSLGPSRPLPAGGL